MDKNELFQKGREVSAEAQAIRREIAQDIKDAARENRDWVSGEEYRKLEAERNDLREALHGIITNVALMHLDINGDDRYALNHRAHGAIKRAKEVLKGGGS
jgi:DNA topoisomerase VI subunit B